jgi:hypothetical protein
MYVDVAGIANSRLEVPPLASIYDGRGNGRKRKIPKNIQFQGFPTASLAQIVTGGFLELLWRAKP